MSLKKAPAEKVRTKRQLPPESWEIEYGAYRENLRLCSFPPMKKDMVTGLVLMIGDSEDTTGFQG